MAGGGPRIDVTDVCVCTRGGTCGKFAVSDSDGRLGCIFGTVEVAVTVVTDCAGCACGCTAVTVVIGLLIICVTAMAFCCLLCDGKCCVGFGVVC